MNVAFIATLNLDDLSDLPDQARAIEESLTHAGYEVVTVVPWRRPSLEVGGIPDFQPEQTTQPQQPIETNIL